jgi:hypothetical protein
MRTLQKLLTASALAIALVGCGDSGNPADMAMPKGNDLAMAPGGDLAGNGNVDMAGGSPDMAPTCSMNPMTYLDIINACTTAVQVTKSPVLPKLNPDGTLPPLPN